MEMFNVQSHTRINPVPNSGSSVENKKNIGSQIGQTDQKKKKLKKKKIFHRIADCLSITFSMTNYSSLNQSALFPEDGTYLK
jgi:hypothetical protein